MPTTRVRFAPLVGLAVLVSCSVGSLFDDPPSKVIAVTPARVIDSAVAGESQRSSKLVITGATVKITGIALTRVAP